MSESRNFIVVNQCLTWLVKPLFNSRKIVNYYYQPLECLGDYTVVVRESDESSALRKGQSIINQWVKCGKIFDYVVVRRYSEIEEDYSYFDSRKREPKLRLVPNVEIKGPYETEYEILQWYYHLTNCNHGLPSDGGYIEIVKQVPIPPEVIHENNDFKVNP